MTRFPVDILRDSPTPLYYYDLSLLKATLDALKAAVSIDPRFHVHYAVKANARPALLNIIRSYGLGADCVSGNEVNAALEAGFKASDIVFAGVGKTDSELTFALNSRIGCFNVESEQELIVIDDLARRCNTMAPIAIRVNPGIDAHTHRYITTGLDENKFGISLSRLDAVIDLARSLKNVRLIGLHFHIGSQILDLSPYEILCRRINSLIDEYATKGIEFKLINVGGGLGIDYTQPDGNPIPDFKAYFDVFKTRLHLSGAQQLHFELGRSIVGQCGSLISRVIYIKHGDSRNFAIIDAGMTDLIRPALYQAKHLISPLTAAHDAQPATYDIVGPVCESSDTFATGITLPELKRGDLIAIRSAGAYGETMASRYNLRDIAHALLI